MLFLGLSETAGRGPASSDFKFVSRGLNTSEHGPPDTVSMDIMNRDSDILKGLSSSCHLVQRTAAVQPRPRRRICTNIGDASALFSFKCCATMSASARINTGGIIQRLRVLHIRLNSELLLHSLFIMNKRKGRLPQLAFLLSGCRVYN